MHWHHTASENVRGLARSFTDSRISLTLADMRLPDAPLIGVNDAFVAMTGYDPQHSLGRNCRFLQPAGGAGPVRSRMREFLQDSDTEQDKFVVPNVTFDGKEFLNLVYMTKLRRGDELTYVLGSQFNITTGSAAAIELYDTALREDVKSLGKLAGEHGLVMLGSYESLASSQGIIAKARMEGSNSAK